MELLVNRCEKIFEKGEPLSTEQVENLQNSLRRLRKCLGQKKRFDDSSILFKSLAVVLTLNQCFTGTTRKERALEEVLDMILSKKVRKNARVISTIARLCIPGKEPRDYNRYADAVSIALDRGLRPIEFYLELLLEDGGMSGFIKRGSDVQ